MIKVEKGRLIQVTASGKRFAISSGRSDNRPQPTIGTEPIEHSFYPPSYFRFLSALAEPTTGNVTLRLHNKQHAEKVIESRFHMSAIGAAIMNCRYAERLERIFAEYIASGDILEIATDTGLGNRGFVHANKREKTRLR